MLSSISSRRQPVGEAPKWGNAMTRVGFSASVSTERSGKVWYARRLVVTLLLAAVFAGSMGTTNAHATDPLSGDPVIMAAGDIACSPHAPQFNSGAGNATSCKMMATSNLILADSSVDKALAFGDLQYECGNYNDIIASYDITWGRFKAMTKPALGNHEYGPTDGFGFPCPRDGSGYFRYFSEDPVVDVGGPTGYYSWDIGTWHMVVVNSNCKFAPCKKGSAQHQWLQADLAASNTQCTLAYAHHPRFNGKSASPVGQTGPLWTLLYNEGAEMFLAGHKHAYARFAPLTPSGVTDPVTGIREFIVGTGGINSGSISNSLSMVEAVDPAKRYGVIRMVLHPTSYDWQMIAINGSIIDSGSYPCH